MINDYFADFKQTNIGSYFVDFEQTLQDSNKQRLVAILQTVNVFILLTLNKLNLLNLVNDLDLGVFSN